MDRMENSIMNPSLVRKVNGAWVTDSMVIAREFERDHSHLCHNIIIPYESEIASLSDDKVAGICGLMKTEVVSGLTKQRSVAYLLNEDQTIFVLTLMGNGVKREGEGISKVVKAKQRIVLAFAKAREELNARSGQSDFYIPKTLPEALRFAAELQDTIEREKPMVAYTKGIFGEPLVQARDIARFYGWNAQMLNAILHDCHLLVLRHESYSKYRLNPAFEDDGLAVDKRHFIAWTPKGQTFIHKLLAELDIEPVIPILVID